ncbi:MAG: hypothetical protein IH861_16045 [Chloroflexi bacterium]|nr:hypothetical protein [Chloroflexota bacterium]
MTETTNGTVSEADKAERIHQFPCDEALPLNRHFVDAAYVDAESLISSREQFDIGRVRLPAVQTAPGGPK